MDGLNFTNRLGGKWHGHYGTAPCPVCQPDARHDQNALTISNGGPKLLLHCKKSDCAFRDILAAAGVTDERRALICSAAVRRHHVASTDDAEKRAQVARRIWQETQAIEGTVAEVYLRGRGITCPLPKTLRFHPACWHGATSTKHPAMVAKVDGCKGFAVHRTYLSLDGKGKARVAPSKAMLGRVSGGSVHLTAMSSRLVVAEGIETALSLNCGLLKAPRTIWAALSTSGLRSLHLPEDPGELIIAPDADQAGLGACWALAQRADQAGWMVSVVRPPTHGDFNDMLRAEVSV